MVDILITDAGLALMSNPPVGVSAVIFEARAGSGRWTPDATATDLQTPIVGAVGRVEGGHEVAEGAGISLTLTALFRGAGQWTANEIGFWAKHDNQMDSEAVLFGIATNGPAPDGAPLVTKLPNTTHVQTFTLHLGRVAPGSVTTLVDLSLTVPDATTTVKGKVELADTNDPQTDDERAVPPSLMKTRLDALMSWVQRQIAAIDLSPYARTTAVAAALLGYVQKAGDTMTGALHLVTPAANDNSKRAVNSEWVRGRLPEFQNASIQRIDNMSASGVVLSGRNAEVSIPMKYSMNGFYAIYIEQTASHVTRRANDLVVQLGGANIEVVSEIPTSSGAATAKTRWGGRRLLWRSADGLFLHVRNQSSPPGIRFHIIHGRL